MLTVAFEDLDHMDNALLKYAVIMSRHQGKWIYCKHKNRNTWEIPGGKRDLGEPILHTAKRELYEETGALGFELLPICNYSVTSAVKGYGLLCYADICELGPLPDSEIELIQLFDGIPDELTYPLIQPFLFEKVQTFLLEK